MCKYFFFYYRCPRRHIGCTGQQESSSTLTNFAQVKHFEEKPKQDVTDESSGAKPSDVNSRVDHLLEVCTKANHQHVNSEQLDFPEPGLEPSEGLEEPPTIAASTDNISSSTTSENSSFLQHSAIEKSSDDIPVLSYEQSKTDCDAGGKSEAVPQSRPPSYVSLSEGPPEKPSDGSKGNLPETELSEIPKTILPEAEEQNPELEKTSNTSEDMLNEEFSEVSAIPLRRMNLEHG
ncbi:uncharacterized protein LOC125481456, partial [Rhincodon typus]|uniref:uncharacterized protein LOC125481456 n=1 Tax=Rhincodon typus TaxID=259920 RepID=UPI00202F987B